MSTASELLQVWELGQSVTAPERALLLLAVAKPVAQSSVSTLGDLPVGERDGYLLALRERLFGRGMICVAPCPGCGERLELPVDTRQFASAPVSNQKLVLEQNGFRIRFRIPTGTDLVECAAEQDVTEAEQRLLRRCILEASRHKKVIEVEDLPEALIEALTQAMEAADPGADLQVEACCPLCDHRWGSTFDIVSFLWTELQDWAIRMLHEVHAIAAAYGWSEQDILDLSPWRRRLYLRMVRP